MRNKANPFTYFWLLWIGAFLLIEGIAIGTRKTMNTLSGFTWKYLRNVRSARILLYPLLSWLVWHWGIDSNPHYGWTDAIAVAVGLLAAPLAPDRKGLDKLD